MKKLQLLESLIPRHFPKFSGCGYYAIPKNNWEYECSRFHNQYSLSTHQEQIKNYYLKKYPDLETPEEHNEFIVGDAPEK